MSKSTRIILIALAVVAAALYGLFIFPRQQAERSLDTYLAALPNISASEHGPVYYDVANGNLRIEKLRVNFTSPRGVSLHIGHFEMRGFSSGPEDVATIDELTLADVKVITPGGSHTFDRIVINTARLQTELFRSGKLDSVGEFARAFLKDFEANRVEIRGVRSAAFGADASTNLTVDSAILSIIRDQSIVRAVLVNSEITGKASSTAPETSVRIEEIDGKDLSYGALFSALDQTGDAEIGAGALEIAGDILINRITQISGSGTTTRYEQLAFDSLEIGGLSPSIYSLFQPRGADITAWAELLLAVRFDAALITGVHSVAADETNLLVLNKLRLEGFRSGTLNSAKLESFQGREADASAFFTTDILLLRDLEARQALIDISQARSPDINQIWARDITVRNFAFEDDQQGEIAAISKLRLQRGDFVDGWPRTGTIELSRLRINTQAATGPVDNSVLQALGYGRLVLSVNLTQDWSPETGVLRFSDGSVILSSGGTIKFDINFRDVDPGFFANGLSALSFIGLTISGAAVEYEDDGLVARIIKRSAVGTSRTFDAARIALLTSINEKLKASPYAELADDLTAAATALANGGGKAALTARPGTVVSIASIMRNLASGEPGVLEQLNLNVTYDAP